MKLVMGSLIRVYREKGGEEISGGDRRNGELSGHLLEIRGQRGLVPIIGLGFADWGYRSSLGSWFAPGHLISGGHDFNLANRIHL